MTADEYRNLIRRWPFEPFRIRMSSGDAYEVRHPEFAWLLKGGIYVGLPADKDELPDRAVFCSLLHVAAIETLASA